MVVTACPPRGMKRCREKVDQRHTLGPCHPYPDLTGRVNAVAELTRPCPGHRDDGKRGDSRGNCRHHQIGEWGHAPVFEPVHELTGHTLVLERRHQADSAIEYSFRRRTQLGPAPSAEEAAAGRMTGMAQHYHRPYRCSGTETMQFPLASRTNMPPGPR